MGSAVRTDDERPGKGTMHLRGGRGEEHSGPNDWRHGGIAVGGWGTLDTWRHNVGLRA